MSRTSNAWSLVAPLARAVDALLAGDAVDVTPLLPVVRETAIAGYKSAVTDVVDVAALVDVLHRRPGVLTHVVDERVELRDDYHHDSHVPRRHRAARALVDALILSLEGHKLRWGLRPSPASLKAHFSSPDDARAALAAVAAAPSGIVVVPVAPSSSSRSAPPHEGVHLVVGPAARRVHEMLSPAVRRLRVDLALLGRHNGVVEDDDVYRGLAVLDAREPGCRAERVAADALEGVVDDGGVFVIEAMKLHEELVDRRLRSLVLPLKKARVVVVGIVDDDDVDFGCTLQPKSVQVLLAGTSPSTAPWYVDAASGALWPGDPRERQASLSVPSPLLAPVDIASDDGAWRLLQALGAWQLARSIPAPTVRCGDDLSALCAVAVAALVAIAER